VIVISNIDTKTLKRGARYPVLKVIEKQVGYIGSNTKKYRIVGDDGACRAYKAEYFREVDDMLNGKFKCTRGFTDVDGEMMKLGKVYDFKDGVCEFDDGMLSYAVNDYISFNNFYEMQIQPHKEYLTINELEEGKEYVEKDGYIYSVMEGNLFNDSLFDIPVMTFKDFNLMQFTEANPNQKRIDELNKLIELEESYIRTSNIEIDNYKQELEELL